MQRRWPHRSKDKRTMKGPRHRLLLSRPSKRLRLEKERLQRKHSASKKKPRERSKKAKWLKAVNKYLKYRSLIK